MSRIQPSRGPQVGSVFLSGATGFQDFDTAVVCRVHGAVWAIDQGGRSYIITPDTPLVLDGRAGRINIVSDAHPLAAGAEMLWFEELPARAC